MGIEGYCGGRGCCFCVVFLVGVVSVGWFGVLVVGVTGGIGEMFVFVGCKKAWWWYLGDKEVKSREGVCFKLVAHRLKSLNV